MIEVGQLPPPDAVRIEEMINYFDYDYPQPKSDVPFSITSEVAACPWEPKHRLVSIGLQGKAIPTADLPASNLVFLIDVSGSMESADKLPLLISSFKLLVNQLRTNDKIAIVVYAGAAGVVLPPTSGNEKETIIQALNKLEAGGSTAGGAGIELAYKLAKENFIPKGNNRVILATDGDFNVGVSSEGALVRMIEEKRKSGIFLTVMGFGTGNYQDDKMQQLADKGNGNHAYIDNLSEARKVLVKEFGGTLFTIAKDVKLQLEFNPAKVAGYRLIGYENRLLANEDFKDDTKDAGELGSGHTVTALYEIIPVGVESKFLADVDELKYQRRADNNKAQNLGDILTVKFRYKAPDGDKSSLIEEVVYDRALPLERASDNFRWSAAVAEFGMLLHKSIYKGDATYSKCRLLADGARGKDEEGYRREMIKLLDLVGALDK
jgi:Ca-activated chloride channel family protein